MNILVSHFGIFKKGGWGRTFSLAESLVVLGNNVTVLTTNPGFSLVIQKKKINGVIVYIFPDIVPSLLTSKGFGVLSLLLRLLYVIFNRFEILHSDSGHRPSAGWPCLLNRLIYKGIYVSEWWDFFGKGGQLENKPKYFKILLGGFEKWSEINDKKKADGIVVLSSFMKERAQKLGIRKDIEIIHGGADIINIPRMKLVKNKSNYIDTDKKILLGYIGMSESELSDLEPFIKGGCVGETNIQAYNLGGIIKEMGWVDYSKNSELLSIVDIFVLIKKESDINLAGWPNKLGDYLACGRPVLLNPYGDVTEFVNKNKECFIITTWNKTDIEEKIQEIIEGKYHLENMAEKARYIAEHEISWLNRAKILNNFYLKLKLNKTN